MAFWFKSDSDADSLTWSIFLGCEEDRWQIWSLTITDEQLVGLKACCTLEFDCRLIWIRQNMLLIYLYPLDWLTCLYERLSERVLVNRWERKRKRECVFVHVFTLNFMCVCECSIKRPSEVFDGWTVLACALGVTDIPTNTLFFTSTNTHTHGSRQVAKEKCVWRRANKSKRWSEEGSA